MREAVHVSSPDAGVVDRSQAAVHARTIYVVQTSVDETLAAVPVALELAARLQVPVTVVDFRTPSAGAPLDALDGIRPGAIDPHIDRFRARGLDVRLRVYLCMHERQAFPLAF